MVFIHIEHICTFFSATIDGRDLIFGHKLHIGTPYRGKRFWTHQIPTSCLPTLLIFIHIEHIFCMPIFRRIFLSNYWWQKSDIWSQALYRYPILWEAFFDPSDSYFLFAEERGHHKWALAHSSSCYFIYIWFKLMLKFLPRYFMPYSEVIWHSDVHASRRVWQISDELTHGWWNRNLCPQICDMHIQTCTNEDPPGSIGIKPLVAQVLYRLQWRK